LRRENLREVVRLKFEPVSIFSMPAAAVTVGRQCRRLDIDYDPLYVDTTETTRFVRGGQGLRQPAIPVKATHQAHGHTRHGAQGEKVAIFSGKFWHVLKIWAINNNRNNVSTIKPSKGNTM
jgi:hypothetical protein